MATMKTARSPLFYRNPAGGLPYINNEMTIAGNVFWVDSAAAGASDTAGHGFSPDSPFATIDYGISQCVANQGDLVLVLPGHAETINTAGAIDLDIAGITVRGLGNGEDRPTITVGSTLDTATVVISAADCKLANVILVPGNDGVDILLDINADGAIVEDVELRSNETDAYQADSYIDINGGANGADRCTLRRVKIRSITAGAANGIEIGAVEDDLVIEDCDIDGDFSNAGIHSGSIFTNAMIRRNAVRNRQTGDHAIELTAACTGQLLDNRLFGDTLGTILDPGSLFCAGNLESDAIDQAGVDSPRTSAGGFPDNSITAASIATDAIDADAMADGAITAATFAAGAIDAAAIANGAIDAATFAAGAIDAAAIAVGAIEADAFAAGAINAAAIANGAIDAATFAAGAIDAAAIAAGAIDAATFAAGAIDAAAIAAGAIDADALAADAVAEIADGVLDEAVSGHVTAATAGAMLQPLHSSTATGGSNDSITLADAANNSNRVYLGTTIQIIGGTGVGQSRRIVKYVGSTRIATIVPKWTTNPDNTSVYVIHPGNVPTELTTEGVVVTRSTAALPQTAAAAIFTVAGLCLVKRIVGYVTTQIGAVANATKLVGNSAGAGASTDLCAALDINGHAVDSRYEITGTFANAMVRTLDVPLAKVQVTDVVIPPGTIDLDCAGSDGGTGRVQWSVTYVPMEDAASIIPA